MSPQLPARPNLEHLRNEAKQRLETLRRSDPAAKLTDAQRLVARAYGFASWRELKASVDERTRQRIFEAGADVIGAGDDHQLGVLGWATCLGRLREDGAAYLLQAGATLDVWSAIALGRARDVRRLIEHDRGLLGARLSRSEHRRTPLHHAGALNRPDMARLLIDLGADVAAADDTGATPVTVAALGGADPAMLAMLEQAGARLDLLGAVSLERYDVAQRLLTEEPGQLGPDRRCGGSSTTAWT